MTIGILSWGSEQTLENTLRSYWEYQLGKDEQKIVLLQEGTQQQESMCRYFGWVPHTLPLNIGIALGYEYLVNLAEEEFFLFLENDWELLRWPQAALQFGRALINSGSCDIIRYRDRENPGNPLWTRQFEGNEYERPSHLLDSIHWTDPSRFPEIRVSSMEYFIYEPLNALRSLDPFGIPDVRRATMNWYITSSKYANWTNNPHMAYTRFLKENLLPRLKGGNLESDIQGWWEQQDFHVGQSDGLFTHNRLD